MSADMLPDAVGGFVPIRVLLNHDRVRTTEQPQLRH